MYEYGKTENVFTRDPDTHKLNVGELRLPEFGVPAFWHVTEKIDGTNMRVVYDPKSQCVDIRGRSDRAQVPGDLKQAMAKFFSLDEMRTVFDDFLGDERIDSGARVTVFGEGYGPGIQKGGYYGAQKEFAVFDIMYHWPAQERTPETIAATPEYRHSWCNPSTVRDICVDRGWRAAPLIMGRMALPEVLDYVRWASSSAPLGGSQFEGVVARTDPYLYRADGSRVMFKLKREDLELA